MRETRLGFILIFMPHSPNKEPESNMNHTGDLARAQCQGLHRDGEETIQLCQNLLSLLTFPS